MIRAGFITPSLYWGGAERWLHDLALFSRDRIAWVGCAVTQPTYNDDTMRKMIGKIMPIWGYGRTAVQHVGAAADVLIAWGTDNLAALTKGYSGKVVYTAHGSGEFDKRTARRGANGATHLAAVSRKALDAFSPFVDTSTVEVLLNGINPARCKIDRTREAVRRELGVAPDEFVVGYLGRLAPDKRPAIIAEAVACLPEEFVGVWVGDGWDQDKQKAAITRALGRRAIFHPRIEDIGNYLQAFDCFVLASPSEGFSMAMLEAMLVGVPLVCTPVGAIPELREKHGQLWEEVPIECTAKQLAKAIQTVKRMPMDALVERIIKAKAAVEENYLGQHMADRWVKYLERIIPTTGDKT